jgi:hypothetical protein
MGGGQKFHISPGMLVEVLPRLELTHMPHVLDTQSTRVCGASELKSVVFTASDNFSEELPKNYHKKKLSFFLTESFLPGRSTGEELR